MTKGAILLRKLLTKIEPSALAREVKVGRVTIWRWASGKRVPGIADAMEVERVSRENGVPIPVESWGQTAPNDRRPRRSAAPDPAAA